ncbi:SWIB/MDM2 domain superfamily protein [Raphanus sativus]|uniref:Upstream activation factor subunit UAF30-like n=1 Tax=Raphanus sativus TaxID=3726 RepID=A0A9W3DQK2_RAPSA|nr:upstream activation factor subunit UAF30-like [Raphanus sativus]KAJ4898972.1 SWIB/MDM2 domain superfamily protein [Raphanus sativus]
MALSSGTFSTFLRVDTAPFRSSPSLLISSCPANMRMVRAVTSATAAASSSEPSSTTKTREPRGIMKPRPVTPEMQDVVGESVIPRTQALKRIWAYIKEHDLQDPRNKKVIICDEKLKKIFDGKDSVGFLEIAKLIGPHFL